MYRKVEFCDSDFFEVEIRKGKQIESFHVLRDYSAAVAEYEVARAADKHVAVFLRRGRRRRRTDQGNRLLRFSYRSGKTGELLEITKNTWLLDSLNRFV